MSLDTDVVVAALLVHDLQEEGQHVPLWANQTLICDLFSSNNKREKTSTVLIIIICSYLETVILNFIVDSAELADT